MDQRRDDGTTADSLPLSNWFLGPKAENAALWTELLSSIFNDYVHWRRNFHPDDPVVISRKSRHDTAHSEWTDELTTALDSILDKLKAHFPFYSPRYIGHMLSEQTLPSVLGYFAGMLYNPNNVTPEAAPVTVQLEIQVGQKVARMLGYDPEQSWAHLCSGGTVANLEALWVARMVQFLPFIVRGWCRSKDPDLNSIDVSLRTPGGEEIPIKEWNRKELIHLPAGDALNVFEAFRGRFLAGRTGADRARAKERLRQAFTGSRFNPCGNSFPGVLHEVGLLEPKVGAGTGFLAPKLFVSNAAHYSVEKAANVLGYGEGAVERIPYDEQFRIRTDLLEQRLSRLKPEREYVAAVIGIAGTTEEGAVDPVHEILEIRNRLWKDKGRSFWFHVDAAWGGYIRSAFLGRTPDREKDEQFREVSTRRTASILGREITYSWPDKRAVAGPDPVDTAVREAFRRLKEADSITVDPHKMGYVPYPAGIVAFRSRAVTELFQPKAPYIFAKANATTPHSAADAVKIDKVGPYILEGSKPGAVATSCWLAHETIPLDERGHGKIALETVLNARKFHELLRLHRTIYAELDEMLPANFTLNRKFTFEPLYEPDTNIVCFVALPTNKSQGRYVIAEDTDLAAINLLNGKIYGAFSIDPETFPARLPYGQPFFLSHTTLSGRGDEAIGGILKRLQIAVPDGQDELELLVLRSTIMNPFYEEANSTREGKSRSLDYLYEFLKGLHLQGRAASREIEAENIRPARSPSGRGR